MQKLYKGTGFWITLIAMVLIFNFISKSGFSSKEMVYSDFVNQLSSENVARMIIDDTKVTCFLKNDITETPFVVNIPSVQTLNEDCGEILKEQMKEGTLVQQAAGKKISVFNIFNAVSSVVIILLFLFMIFSRSGKSGGSLPGNAEISKRISRCWSLSPFAILP